MYAFSFLLAAILFVLLSVFVFMNLPRSWRKDRLFVTMVILWHIVGCSALICVFTVFKSIRYENFRYEVCRIATFYIISTMLLALLYFVRIIYSRTFQFILRYNGRETDSFHWQRLSDKRYHAALFIFLSFTICFTGYFNIDFLHLQHYDISSSAGSADKELRICLIADIHAGSGTWEYTYDDMIDCIDECDPDVLLIAGDLFDETTARSDAENFAWVIESIKPPRYGIYYVYGNHDGLKEDWGPGAADQFQSLGITILEDEMVLLGEDIQLIGCLDPKLHAENFTALFNRLNPDPDKPIIVMTHRPKHFKEMSALGVDLAVAGHTHGFNIPQFLGTIFVNDMLDGIKKYGEMSAITTSGVGAWGFHYKWPAQSEVVSITIHFNESGDNQK